LSCRKVRKEYRVQCQSNLCYLDSHQGQR